MVKLFHVHSHRPVQKSLIVLVDMYDYVSLFKFKFLEFQNYRFYVESKGPGGQEIW
jgi:hypothetical protein